LADFTHLTELMGCILIMNSVFPPRNYLAYFEFQMQYILLTIRN